METERLRTAQIQAERTLEARERAHRQRVKGLEEQVNSVFITFSYEIFGNQKKHKLDRIQIFKHQTNVNR